VSEDTTERRKIDIAGSVTVGELAELLELPATRLIGELFKNGIAATINQRIDVDTAQIIVDELELSVEIVQQAEEVKVTKAKEAAIVDMSVGDWRLRPPVVAIMGHVDHGKTTLLDKILGLKVADGEAGGITQHIASYQAKHKDRLITFLDTPGHEAFSALRQHGAALTDIAVIVVAGDDGVKPQTLEAIRFAKEEKVKLIIAITKVDKPETDLNKVKQDLVNAGLTPEEWGGDTIVVEVSAKTGSGVDDLLDMILLVADVEELKADYSEGARGLVVESHMAKGVGSLAKVLITKGELKQGDSIVIGSSYGKARIMKDWKGEDIKVAGPTTPVQLSGLKSLPDFGDTLFSASSEKDARRAAESATQATKSMSMNSDELLRVMSHRNELMVMPVIVKADVAGSLRSVVDSIQLVATGEVEAKVIGSGVGDITESDVMLASSSNAVIYGFHVSAPQEIKRMAQSVGVKIRDYKIIYELIDDVKANLSNLLEPDVVDSPMGRLLVRGVFRTTDDEVVCGGEVTKGTIMAGFRAKIFRGETELGDAEITSVQEKNQEVKEVRVGTMCGLKLKSDNKLKLDIDDRLEVYKREIIEKTL
jgi:translation initiation factor IF-2